MECNGKLDKKLNKPQKIHQGKYEKCKKGNQDRKRQGNRINK